MPGSPPQRSLHVINAAWQEMELVSAAFRDVVTDLLGRDVALVATVQTARHPFTDALKQRPEVRP